jgi:hypothetical protein
LCHNCYICFCRLLGRNKNAAESIAKSEDKAQQPQKKSGFFGSKKTAEKKDAAPSEKKLKKGFFLPFERPELYDSKRGLFRRSSRSVVPPAPAKPDAVEEARENPETPADVAPQVEPTAEQTATPPAPMMDETPQPAEHSSPKSPVHVVPETVHSVQDDDVDDATHPSPVPSPKADTPMAEARSPRNEDDDKDEEDSPAENEGREQGEQREKPSSSREGTDRASMSIEEPAEENTGLLCGCI